MPGTDFSNHSEGDLASHADDGLRGQGAIVEAIRRHREATNALDNRMWWVGLIGVVLAAVGVVLAAIQVWVALR